MPARPDRPSHHRSRTALATTTALAAVLAVPALAGPAAASTTAEDATPYTVQTLHLAVTVGVAGTTPCDVVADLYVPTDAGPTQRVTAVLLTNGFGGSKDDQATMAEALAARDYVALSYSGLGFGGSTCPISMDDPDVDGRAASDLVSYLGGADGIAFTDAEHTHAAAPIDTVTLDRAALDGKAHDHDPRVGMLGGSYAGAVQLAAAAVDPRIDALVPMITWNDLSAALFPNDTARTSGVSSSTPGAMKLHWTLGLGLAGMVTGSGKDDTSLLTSPGCDRFIQVVCPTLLTGVVQGYPSASQRASLERVSPVSYLAKVEAPTLLIQGEHDTLFDLDQAAATYETLHAQGTPVQMIWQQPGHSDGAVVPGDWDYSAPDPQTQYLTGRVFDWFAHYLRDAHVSTGPTFAYFRDWVRYDGVAAPAYGTSDSFPVGTAKRYYLSASQLVSDGGDVVGGSQSFLTAAGGLPTSIDPLDIFGALVGGPAQAEADLPGTTARWSSGTLDSPLDVAGSPSLHLAVSAPASVATQGLGPSGQLVVFAKLLDVAPDGTSTLVANQVAPARIPDVTKPFTVTLPAVVHRFEPGHQLRLVVAAGSANYRGGLFANLVTVRTGSTSQSLTLPVVG